MALPVLTPEQREKALEAAAAARKTRTAALTAVRDGTLTVAGLLATDDKVLLRTPVRSILLALPGIGDIKADQIMTDIGIGRKRRVGGLSPRQREALGDRFMLAGAAS